VLNIIDKNSKLAYGVKDLQLNNYSTMRRTISLHRSHWSIISINYKLKYYKLKQVNTKNKY